MKTLRVLLTAITVWIAGVGTFIASYYVPLLSDPDLQANIALSLSLIPLGWLGSLYFYSKYNSPGGYFFGLIMVLTAVILDGLVTVPFLVIPNGGTYLDFFGAASFWFIAIEYCLVVVLYWYVRVKPRSVKSFN